MACGWVGGWEWGLEGGGGGGGQAAGRHRDGLKAAVLDEVCLVQEHVHCLMSGLGQAF